MVDRCDGFGGGWNGDTLKEEVLFGTSSARGFLVSCTELRALVSSVCARFAFHFASGKDEISGNRMGCQRRYRSPEAAKIENRSGLDYSFCVDYLYLG